MALNIEISDEKINDSFKVSLDEILSTKNYSNPVKKVLDEMLGYGGSMKGELGEQITNFLKTCMETPEFKAQLGQAIADEMARRAVDGLEKKK